MLIDLEIMLCFDGSKLIIHYKFACQTCMKMLNSSCVAGKINLLRQKGFEANLKICHSKVSNFLSNVQQAKAMPFTVFKMQLNII